MVDLTRDQLDALLAESLDAARVREAGRLGVIEAGVVRPVVVLGAGGLGRRTLLGLRALGREVVAFADNASDSWGTRVEGVPVLAPSEAARLFGADALFVVAIWRAEGGFRTADLLETLRTSGCLHVARIGELFWAHPTTFLPYFGIDLPSRVLAETPLIREAFALLDDDVSRRVFVEQVRWRLWLDAGGIQSDPSIYFPKELVALRDDEVFVDGGAFDGDTVRAFVAASGGRFSRVIALEPDPRNHARLVDTVRSLGLDLASRIDVHPYALGASDGEATFLADGTGAARLSRSRGTLVAVRRLGSIPHADAVTYLKLDIEGAEPAAIEGARPILEAQRPLLAVSVYHEQNHPWRVLLQLARIVPEGYRWSLRAHGDEGFDLVLYGMPQERRPPGHEPPKTSRDLP